VIDPKDEQAMRLAIDQAQNAWLVGEVPVGAVIVRDTPGGRQVVATGYNRPITEHDPTAHAEIVALRHAAALLANYRGVVNQLDLYRRATISRGLENIPLSTQEHEAIVEAVAARDERRAEALLTEHVLVSRARLHAALGVASPNP